MPKTRVLGRNLNDTHTLVGDNGGLSTIYSTEQSNSLPGMLLVTTEHGPLYLDPDELYDIQP